MVILVHKSSKRYTVLCLQDKSLSYIAQGYVHSFKMLLFWISSNNMLSLDEVMNRSEKNLSHKNLSHKNFPTVIQQSGYQAVLMKDHIHLQPAL